MNLRLPAIAALAITGAALTACGGPTYTVQPVVTPTVLQQCTATYPDGSVEVVPDDYCVDHTAYWYGGHSYTTIWHYSGSTYRTGNRYYVRGGTTVRPVNVIINVRQPRYGGSARAQGMTRSYNEQVRKQLGTTPTYHARSGWSGSKASVKSGDDRRSSLFGGKSGRATGRSGTRR